MVFVPECCLPQQVLNTFLILHVCNDRNAFNPITCYMTWTTNLLLST